MTARLKRIPLFGEGITSKSPVVTRQRRLNCYLEVRKDGDKSTIVCYGTPGLRRLFTDAFIMRGMIGTDTALYTVSNNQIARRDSAGLILGSGLIGTSSGLVGMALNPTQVLIVDGSAGYIYTPATNVVTVIGGAFPNGARSAAYCNGFFACEQPGSNQFFISAFNDGITWNGLSFAAAVQSIDGIVAVDTLGGLLIPMSSGHIEFWQNVGTAPEPFQYIQNSASMIGLEALNSRVHAGESLLFLAHTGGASFQNSTGSIHIAKISGYTCNIVSNDDVDNILQEMKRTSIVSDCTGYSYEVDGHVFAQFNFPTAGRSLLYDVTTGFWSEVQSGITPNYAARHLGNIAAGAFNLAYVADASNGNVYTYDPTVFTDNGNVIVREVVTRAALEDFNTFRISQIYVDMQTGVGLSQPGPGYAPVVELSVARDNRNFGAQRLFSLGALGQYTTRVIGRRWGRVRTSANLRIRMTDPVPFVITSGAIVTSSRAGRQTPRTAPAGRRAA